MLRVRANAAVPGSLLLRLFPCLLFGIVRDHVHLFRQHFYGRELRAYASLFLFALLICSRRGDAAVFAGCCACLSSFLGPFAAAGVIAGCSAQSCGLVHLHALPRCLSAGSVHKPKPTVPLQQKTRCIGFKSNSYVSVGGASAKKMV